MNRPIFSHVRAVLFDLDGTLVDSAEDLRHALNIILAERGLRTLDLPEVKSMIGDGAAKLVERGLAATGGDLAGHADALRDFLAIYEANAADATRPYPGTIETLEALRANRLPLAVVTNKPEAATALVLEALGLASFFDVVVGGDTLPQRKPHPAPILHALAALGMTPGAAVMIGDNHHDVKAAKAAGTGAIAVTYGYSHLPHAELGADRLIDNLKELLPLLKAVA